MEGTGAPAVHDPALGAIKPILATGVNRTHFWVTASYADVAKGLISVAEKACIAKVKVKWICTTVGSWLKRLAKGYRPLSNHGVWAAVYWAPPRYTGGRW